MQSGARRWIHRTLGRLRAGLKSGSGLSENPSHGDMFHSLLYQFEKKVAIGRHSRCVVLIVSKSPLQSKSTDITRSDSSKRQIEDYWKCRPKSKTDDNWQDCQQLHPQTRFSCKSREHLDIHSANESCPAGDTALQSRQKASSQSTARPAGSPCVSEAGRDCGTRNMVPAPDIADGFRAMA